MDTEKTLSPQESLSLIAEAITKTKEDIKQYHFVFSLWGWLLSIASLSFFLFHKYTDLKYYFFPFPLLAATGMITTVIWYTRRRPSQTETYGTFFLSRMWLVLAICFVTVVFINTSQNLPPFTYTMLLAGIGTLVSGMIMKFRPLIFGGILFLCGSVASIYVDYDYKALLQGMTYILGLLIPGYMLKYSKH